MDSPDQNLKKFIQDKVFVDDEDPEFISEQIQNTHPDKTLKVTVEFVWEYANGEAERKQEEFEMAPGAIKGMILNLPGPSGMYAPPDRYAIQEVKE